LAVLTLLFRNFVVMLSPLFEAASDNMPSKPPCCSEALILAIVSATQSVAPAAVAPNSALEVELRLDTDMMHETYASTVKEA
jgi:hypothetical protein